MGVPYVCGTSPYGGVCGRTSGGTTHFMVTHVVPLREPLIHFSTVMFVTIIYISKQYTYILPFFSGFISVVLWYIYSIVLYQGFQGDLHLGSRAKPELTDGLAYLACSGEEGQGVFTLLLTRASTGYFFCFLYILIIKK